MAYSKNKEKDSSILDIRKLSEYIKAETNLKNLFLIFGEEDFFIDMSIASIKKKYLTEDSLSMDFVKLDFSGKEFDLDKIAQNVELPPWLAEKRVVHVDNFQFPNDTETLEKLLANVPDSTVLIFTTISFDKRKKKLLNAFKDNGIVAESSYLEEEKLIAWITRAFSKSSISINQEAALSIVSRSDSSMRLISSEVNKIVLYCQGSELTNVDMDTVELLCPPDIKGSVFNITDAVGVGDINTALSILDNLIIMKEPPLKIRFMLLRHFKHLICANDLRNKNEIVSRLKVQPFVADKLIRQSSRFNQDVLIKLFMECSRQDVEIKNGNLDERQSLESFIVTACGCK